MKTLFRQINHKKQEQYRYGALLCIGALCAILYGISLKEDTQFYLSIHRYLQNIEQKNLMILFKEHFIFYTKLLLIVWVLGLWKWSSYLGYVYILFMCFAYTFTTTCMVILYGWTGGLKSLFGFGIQSALLLWGVMQIHQNGIVLKEKNTFLMTYLQQLIYGTLGMGILSLLQTLLFSLIFWD